jgi:diguanylate cyclase
MHLVSTPPRAANDSTAQAHPWQTQGHAERLREELAQTRLALEQAQAELAAALRAAGSDALTGLPNRRGFAGPSRRLLAQHDSGEPRLLALLFIDLDGFKAINDRLGHPAGDALLRVVGARLLHALRKGDLVCRQGGDEFLCLLPHLPRPESAREIAAELARLIAAPCSIAGQRVVVTASIGVALYPRDGSSVGALLHSADAAMYAAKSPGRGGPAA